MQRHDHPQLSEYMKQCMPEFMKINHYWDNQRGMVVAKILPGEFYMTTQDVAIATTLGSCISACIWDPRSKIGGMNHFMLPITNKGAHEVTWGQQDKAADATRYGNFAMEHLINTILRSGGRRINLRAKVFGGGKVLNQMSDVGKRNIDFALTYLEQENITIESSDVGDTFPRKVIFEPFSGRAFVKRLDNLHNDTIIQRETSYRTDIIEKDVSGDVELF